MRKHRQSVLIVFSVCILLPLWAADPPTGSREMQLGRDSLPAGGLRWGSPYLDSRLVQLAEIERTQGLKSATLFAEVNAIPLDPDGKVRVLIHESAYPSSQTGEATTGLDESAFAAMEPVIKARVAELGGEVRGRTRNLIEARVGITAIEELPGLREIAWVEPSPRAFPMQVTSQGVEVTRTDQLQASAATYRPSDRPIRVGVLDGGFEGYEGLLGSELPASVTVRSFHPNGMRGDGVHGTAVAEIVHDMAPDAALYLTNFDSVVDHSEAVDWLISQHVDVINYSYGWWNMGPGDGRGVINDHVRRALAAGIEWVVSAGNMAEVHWDATFSDTDGDGWHNYSGTDETNAVWLRAGEVVVVFLSWDDWFQSDQDYDLFIMDESGEVLAYSWGSQNGTQEPTEVAGVVAPRDGYYHVAINRWAASRDVRLRAFFRFPNGPDRWIQYVVPEGSLTIPADTDGAIAVGATYWSDDVLEYFSSLGPTTDGRIKPDLSAPDGVDTASYLAEGGYGFYGTSAAAPHVVGAIALLKSRFGMFSFDQIVEILYGRAADLGPTGKDNRYGEGRLDVVG